MFFPLLACSGLEVVTHSLMGKETNSEYCLIRDCSNRIWAEKGGCSVTFDWQVLGAVWVGRRWTSLEGVDTQRATLHAPCDSPVKPHAPIALPDKGSHEHSSHQPTCSLLASANSRASGFRCRVMRVPRLMSAAASSRTACARAQLAAYS